MLGASASSSARASCPTRRWSARCARSCARATRRLTELPAAARQELAALLPGLAAAPATSGRAAAAREPAQPRLFEALLAALDRSRRERPLLLDLEDIHWADRSTRDFLSSSGATCRRARPGRAELPPRRAAPPPPAAPVAGRAGAHAAARRFELAGWSGPRSPSGAPDRQRPSRRPGRPPRRRSDGNALFVEELLAAAARPLPPSLSDALMVRVERLPAAGPGRLRVLAVAQPADHALLGSSRPRRRRAARRAARRDRGPRGGRRRQRPLRFRHVLLREVVYDDLLPGERAELHLAVARALEAGCRGDGGARGWRRRSPTTSTRRRPARGAARGDARRRRGDGAHAEADAALLLERALELWERVPEPEALAGLRPRRPAACAPPARTEQRRRRGA